MDVQRIEITTASDGSASQTSVPLNGRLAGFKLKLGTAVGADVSLTDADGVPLFSDTGLNASAYHLVRKQVEDTAGNPLTYDGTRVVAEPLPVVGMLTVAIANGGNAKTLSILLFIE